MDNRTSPAPTDTLQAPLWRRLAAMLYDTLLLLACYMLVGGVYVAITQPASMNEHSAVLLQMTLFPLLLLITIAFFCFFWIRFSRTLGMQTWKLKIKSADDSPLTYKQCLIRLLVATVSILAGGLGFLWMLWDPQRLTWQDRASNSRIILNR